MARSQATIADGGQLHDFVHLDIWPEGLPLPALIAGQHRRSALSTLLAEQEKAATEGGLTPDGSPLLHPSPQVSITKLKT